MSSNPPFSDPELEILGGALETNGLTVKGAIFPLGALMFGLVWECGDIWSGNAAPSTSWTPKSTTSSTTWTATPTTSSTSWTEVQRSDC